MIYFVTAREIGRVKIGFSDAPRSRFVKMRTDSPVPLELERICDGSMEDERELHQRFQRDRVNREWFTISDEIEAHMATLPAAVSPKRPQSLGSALTRELGMSRSYACQLANDQRKIPLQVAIAFFGKTGRLIGPISHVTPEQGAVLVECLGDWLPQAKRKA